LIVELLVLLLLAGGFVLGFFRGVVRQVLALAAWLGTFLVAAYLRLPLGDWLARSSSQFSFDYAQMLAFATVFLALFLGALALIEFGGAGSALTRHPLLDDAVGGITGLLLAIVVVASLLVALDTYFLVHPAVEPGEVGWLREIHDDLSASALAEPLRSLVIRPLGYLLGPILPSDIRLVMG
jgi:uncharacterized membrane protein required for colicin V production